MTGSKSVVHQGRELTVGGRSVALTRFETMDGASPVTGQTQRQSPTARLNHPQRSESTHAERQREGEHAVKQRSHADPRDHVHLDAQAKITALRREHEQVRQPKRGHRGEENLAQQLPGETDPSDQ